MVLGGRSTPRISPHMSPDASPPTPRRGGTSWSLPIRLSPPKSADVPQTRANPVGRGASMSRKITASLYMTLDGRGAFPKYPGWDRHRSEANEIWREMWLNRFDDVTTVVMGRRSFLGHRRV